MYKRQKKIRIADLAYAVGFNDPKYFSSCFKKKFGLSPTEYMVTGVFVCKGQTAFSISQVEPQAACRLIDKKKKIRIADLAYAVGFNDPKYFSSCFKKKFGLSAAEYMMKSDG